MKTLISKCTSNLSFHSKENSAENFVLRTNHLGFVAHQIYNWKVFAIVWGILQLNQGLRSTTLPIFLHSGLRFILFLWMINFITKWNPTVSLRYRFVFINRFMWVYLNPLNGIILFCLFFLFEKLFYYSYYDFRFLVVSLLPDIPLES